jgi:hypothetical protein
MMHIPGMKKNTVKIYANAHNLVFATAFPKARASFTGIMRISLNGNRTYANLLGMLLVNAYDRSRHET